MDPAERKNLLTKKGGVASKYTGTETRIGMPVVSGVSGSSRVVAAEERVEYATPQVPWKYLWLAVALFFLPALYCLINNVAPLFLNAFSTTTTWDAETIGETPSPSASPHSPLWSSS